MRNAIMWKGVSINLIVVVLFTGLVACDLLSRKPKKVIFLEDSFSVMMPATWSKRTDLNDNADLQIGNPFKEAYAIIVSENKMDFDNLTLEGHSNLTRSFIKKSLLKYQESEPEYLTTIGKLRALRYRLTGTIEGLNVVYWHVTLETKKYYHQMLIWSLKSKFANNEADFNDVIRSFEVIKE